MKCLQCHHDLPPGRRKFCRTTCKDRWHNENNPRGKYAYLNPGNPDYDDPGGSDYCDILETVDFPGQY
jgi:hypothetical protein